jgi:UPF0271 protein
MTVLVNCDMGEGFGLYRCGDDAGLMPHIDLANVACGFHASDPTIMQSTVRLAKAHGVKVGAHPSFPDLQGFGRREMKLQRDELAACLVYQIGALQAFLAIEGMALSHIKPHGALYGLAARDAETAHAVADAAVHFGVPVLGIAGSQHEAVYGARNLVFLAEYYCDLDYADDGALIITREHVPHDPDEAARRTARVLAEGKAPSINGRDLPMRADCVCVHSDTPGAVDLARAVRQAVRAHTAR